jgi:hypothetical protein
MAAGSTRRPKKRVTTKSNGGPPDTVEAKADEILSTEVTESFSEPAYAANKPHEWSPVQIAAAKLYGQGYGRTQIGRALLDHLTPRNDADGYPRPKMKREKAARSKLRRWEMEQWFRDKVFELAVIKTDLEIPKIMQGVVTKAKRGRVDAAKLALQMAGRITDGADAGPTTVNVVFGGIPRPASRGQIEAEVVEEAEWEDAG